MPSVSVVVEIWKSGKRYKRLNFRSFVINGLLCEIFYYILSCWKQKKQSHRMGTKVFMTDTQHLYRQLLDSLNLEYEADAEEGQTCCVLLDDNNDVAVEIEMPENSDLLLLHRKMAPLSLEPELRMARTLQLLALNACPDKLGGSWFCIDPEGINIHLMSGYPIRLIGVTEFNDLLFNFISLASTLEKELNDELLELDIDASAGMLV